MDITEKVLPEELKHLKLGYNFNKPLSLQSTLTILELHGKVNDKKIIDSLPTSITTLIINNLNFEIINLPSTVTKIILINYDRHILNKIKKIPHGTKILEEDQDVELT